MLQLVDRVWVTEGISFQPSLRLMIHYICLSRVHSGGTSFSWNFNGKDVSQRVGIWSRNYREENVKKNVKSFPSHKPHRAALISVSLALRPTPVYTARPPTRGLVHLAVCLFTSQLSLVFNAPTHGGMARLSWPGSEENSVIIIALKFQIKVKMEDVRMWR